MPVRSVGRAKPILLEDRLKKADLPTPAGSEGVCNLLFAIRFRNHDCIFDQRRRINIDTASGENSTLGGGGVP